MKKWISGALLSVAALGCTHPGVQTPPVKDNVYYLKPGERQPTAVPKTVWHPAVMALEVTSGTNNNVKTLRGEVTQELIWQQVKVVYDDVWEDRDVQVPGTCSRVTCSQPTVPSQLWNDYFSATKDKKADALAKAIDGIGDVSSKALVEKGYFRSKPRSWDDFEAEINRAADAGVIRKSVATMVTENNQVANMNNLGYKKESCTLTAFSCTKVISQRVLTKKPRNTVEEVRSVIARKPVEVRVQVTGAKLLSYEQDRLNIVVDETGLISLEDGNGFNRYTITKQTSYGSIFDLDLVSDTRVLRDLPGNIVLRDGYELIGGKPVFTIELDPTYFRDAAMDPHGQFVLDYDIYTCEYGMLGCWGSWKKMSTTSTVLAGPKFQISTDIALKNKSYISYRVSKQSSEFFNAKPIYERSTQSVVMPKR